MWADLFHREGSVTGICDSPAYAFHSEFINAMNLRDGVHQDNGDDQAEALEYVPKRWIEYG